MDDRAKSVLFPMAEHRTALNRLALVTDAQKQAGAFANQSNSGLVASGAINLATFLTDPVSGLALLGSQFAAGKLLSSPAFARWLARPPRTAAQARVWGGRLKTIAAKNPTIAAEVGQLERALMSASNDNGLTRAVASGDDPRSQEQDQRRPR